MALVRVIDATPYGPRYVMFDAEPSSAELAQVQPNDLVFVNNLPKVKTPGTGVLVPDGATTYKDVVITSAQLLALNATPQTLLAAPGAGLATIFLGATIVKPAGTAYGGIAAGEDLSIKYTDASGLEVAECETTGFLDQSTLQIRHCNHYAAASAVSSITPVANAVLIIMLLVGEITTGTSPLNIRVFYSTVPAV